MTTTETNALLYAITIDPAAKNKEVAARIAQDGKGEITYPILTDSGHKIIDAFGVRNPSFDGQEFAGVPHPAVYIIDKDGKIAWARIDEDYRKRPTNEEIRAVLATLPVKKTSLSKKKSKSRRKSVK